MALVCRVDIADGRFLTNCGQPQVFGCPEGLCMAHCTGAAPHRHSRGRWESFSPTTDPTPAESSA